MSKLPRLRAVASAALILALPAGLSGCNLARVAARSSAALSAVGGPAMEQYFDLEIAGAAMPSTIMQLESMVRAAPDNRQLLLSLTRTYVGYAYSFVEDRVEQLELEQGDYRAGGEQRARAHRMYLRAKDVGLYRLGLDAEDLVPAMARGEQAFRDVLRREFRHREDAAPLFFTGSAWASAIGTSEEGLSDSADLPFARALVQRSVELDPDYQSASGLGFLGALEAQLPDGDYDRSRALFEDAIARTDRHALTLLVNMANTYAVQTQDRALYRALLEEVLAASDERPASRLANLVARRRAVRYLAQIDARFP